jgi:hypothetical protein
LYLTILDRNRRFIRGGLGAVLLLVLTFTTAMAKEREEQPVKSLARRVYTVQSAAGAASVPIEMSLDISRGQPEITRAVIVFHGKGRNVEGYFEGTRASGKRGWT